MIRKILIFILLILIPSSLIFADTETIQLGLELEDDFGIIFPNEAMRLDHFVIAIGDRTTGYNIVTKSMAENIRISERSSITFTLLYYGNLTNDYEVRLSSSPELNWMGENNGETVSIPISVDIYESEDCFDTASVTKIDDSVVDIFIEATGPVRGEPVADITLSWESPLTLMPGIYSTDFSMTLSGE